MKAICEVDMNYQWQVATAKTYPSKQKKKHNEKYNYYHD